MESTTPEGTADRGRPGERSGDAASWEAIGRAAGAAAHDLNNLLTALMGYADLLGERLRGQTAALEDLEEVRKAGRRAMELVAQLQRTARRPASVRLTGGRGSDVPRDRLETILVVEDDDAVRDLVVRELRELGYAVFAAASGPEALELAHGGLAFDLLVSDVMMPVMSGPATAQALRSLRPHFRILFISGYPDEPAKAGGGGGLRGAAVLLKPFSRAVLLRRVRELLDAPLDAIFEAQRETTT